MTSAPWRSVRLGLGLTVERLRAVALIASLGACAYERGPAVLKQPPPALPDAAYWDRVREVADERGETTWFWPLPLFGELLDARAAPDGERVDVSTSSLVNLGLTGVPMLPLWYGSDARQLRSDGAAPATSSLFWTPLWASSETLGDFDERNELFGVPLLYWGVDQQAPGRSLTYRQTLWTLGPAFARFEGQSPYGDGWVFLPVAAGGLGILAWISHERSTPVEDLVAHGPAGLLWMDLTTRGHGASVRHWLPDTEREIVIDRMLVVLGGVLWAEVAGFDAEGQLVHSHQGPLWGLFGGGRDEHGEAFVSLFWMRLSL